MSSGHPLYVRCLSSNVTAAARCFSRSAVSRQLRACGIVDSLRVYAAGRPCHVSYDLAGQRYGPLMKGGSLHFQNQADAVHEMLRRVLGPDADFLCGKTMAFLTEKQLQALDDSLDAIYTQHAVKIQVRT